MNTIEALNGQSNLFTVGDQDFEAKILQSPLPMVVDFTANWCPPCHALAPVYQQLSTEYQGKLGFARLDVDEDPLTPARLHVQACPTLVVSRTFKPPCSGPACRGPFQMATGYWNKYACQMIRAGTSPDEAS